MEFKRTKDIIKNLDIGKYRFPNPLAPGERETIDIIASSLDWDQIDYYYGWFLTDPSNAETNWVKLNLK